ncbi:MAG: hypothetical protein ACO25N_00885 [Candidatus Limnocylindrus sp.]
MYKVRWSLALLMISLLAACGAPSTAIAPSRSPLAEGAGLAVRPIAAIAAQILSPQELRRLVAQPFTLVRSDSGEQRVRQVLVGASGVEAMRVESALDGSLRLIAISGAPLAGGTLSESAAIARAVRHLMRLGLEMPGGGPEVRSAAGRTLVLWAREVRGVLVPGDGTRVVLNGAGELVGLAIEESPLAAPPARLAPSDAALRAAAALMPNGAALDERPEIAWVLPTNEASEPVGQRVQRRLAWYVQGVLRDGTPFVLQLDAGSLALLGWDGAP